MYSKLLSNGVWVDLREYFKLQNGLVPKQYVIQNIDRRVNVTLLLQIVLQTTQIGSRAKVFQIDSSKFTFHELVPSLVCRHQILILSIFRITRVNPYLPERI